MASPETTSVRGCHAAGVAAAVNSSEPSSVTTITFGRSLSGVASWPRCGCAVVHEPVTTRTATLPAAEVAVAAVSSAAFVCPHASIATSQFVEPSVPNARPAHVDHCVSSHAHVAPVLSPGQSRLLALATPALSTAEADLARISSSSSRRVCQYVAKSASLVYAFGTLSTPSERSAVVPETVRSSARPLPTAHTPTSVPRFRGPSAVSSRWVGKFARHGTETTRLHAAAGG